jgi:hypothetical protein
MAGLLAEGDVYINSSHIDVQTYSISKTQQFFSTFAAMSQRCLFILFGIVFNISVFAQEKFTVKKDLHEQWLQFNGSAYVPVSAADAHGVNTVHFELNAGQYPDNSLLIRSHKTFFVFINGKLVKQSKGTLTLPLDSLSKMFLTSGLTVSVYQPEIDPLDLKTEIVTTKNPSNTATGIDGKPAADLKDFVILSGLLLTVFFVVIIRLQPKLAADYFSIRRVVSLREGEDSQTHARFAISSNVWFYIFGSMLTAFFLLILFYHLPEKYLVTIRFRSDSFFMIFFHWIRLSFIILCVLLVKIAVIFLLSNLFGLRGIAGVHFFNGMRLLLIVTSTLTVIIFVYFISRGQDFTVYTSLLSLLIFMLVVWIGLVFFKLNNRIEHSMFHLFSYICATEVIPLLVTVKVLFQ